MKDKKKEKGVSILDRWAQDKVNNWHVLIKIDGKNIRMTMDDYVKYLKTHPKNKEK